MSSTSAGAPPASEAQQQQQQLPQPSTSAANTSLNVQVGNQGPGGAMMSPHAGPSSQPDNRYAYHPYGGKPMHPSMQQRPMAPHQQWLPPHGPDGTSDPMSLSQPPPSNYPGQQQGYPPHMYNNPQLPPPPTSGNNGYWMQPPQHQQPLPPQHQQQQQQQPRYPIHQQQQYPGYGPPPVHHQAYGYPAYPGQHVPPPPQGDWGRMPPQMQYPQPGQQPMQPPPPHQTLQPPPLPQQQQQQPLPPPQAPVATSQPSSSNIAAVANALQSPGAASIGGHDETSEDTKSIRSTSSVPPPHTPARTPAATPSASASATPGTSTAKEGKATSTPAAKHAPPPTREEILEKLCHTNDQIGPELTMQRRQFFETILDLSERASEKAGEPLSLTGPPQVSKSPIDLHRLYIKVKEKGGFEQVTKEKFWKNLCVHANPEMSESSAAGYQLRRHYQKHLLELECLESGANMEAIIATADKLKKKKKEKDPAAPGGSGTPKQAKKEADAAAAAAAAAAQAPPAQQPQQPPQQQQQMAQPPTQPPPAHQTLQPPPPPQGYSQPPPHPHGVPPPPVPGQPGPSYAVDVNGQPIQPYGQPYGYGVPPGWGAPPPHGYPHYPPQQQPRYPHPHMMLPPGQQPPQQGQQGQPPPQHSMPQQHGMPPGVPPQGMPPPPQQQQPSTAQQPPHQPHPQQQQPGRPPMDQSSYEEHQRQMLQQQQQQQRPGSTVASSNTPTPQPQCSTAPGPSEPQQQSQQQQPQPSKPQTPAAQPPPQSVAAATPATSQAPPASLAATPQPPPSSSSQPATSSAQGMPQTSVAPSEAGNTSALANQLGQPPPMGMYGPPPQHMQMYPRMPYGPPQQQHPGMPNGYPQVPPGDQQGQQHPGMYGPPPHQSMYGQQPPQQQQMPPQGWNPPPPQGGMMRPSMPPPQGYPGSQQQQQQPGQQPGQSSAEFWQQQQQQHQQRAAMAAAQQQQQQGTPQQSNKKQPPYFPTNQPPPQASPTPSQRHQAGSHQTPSMPPSQQTPNQQQKMQQPGPSSQQQQQQTPQMPGPSSSQHIAQQQQHLRQQQQQMGMPGPSHQQPQQQHPLLQQQMPIPIKFPPNSVEATAEQFLGPQRRPMKKYTKDLISATPRRIMMALKSNIHMEIVWALNALTVMLYDDSINPPMLSTEILNIIIEHFRASLSLVFPKAFPLEDKKDSNSTASTEKQSETFWEQVIDEAKKNGETLKMKVKLPPAMKNSLGKDLNSISRGGIKIISKDVEMPTKLKEWKRPSAEATVSAEKSYEERRQLGLPTEFAVKVAESMKDFVEQSSFKSDKIKFSKWDDSSVKHFEYDDEVQPKDQKMVDENNVDNGDTTTDDEYYDHEAPLDCSLVPRPIGIFLIPNSIQSYAQLCLSWSNVIRGFSFNPANELHLVNHHGLLRIIGKLLMLYVENSDGTKQLSRRRKQQLEEKDGKVGTKKTSPAEDAAVKAEEEKKRAAMVSTEKDDMRSYLLDVANQLRDDAFTILSFMSGSIDLFDLDSGISYPIFDALIHWTVSHSVLSKDPLVPWGIICPRDFCLEIIAKMSVIDHNVDLLLSTGSWKRIEEFVRIVSDLLHMGEDTPIREFALVIMSALCQASESVCVIAALETNIVKNVISFMEAVDSKMHEVVSTKGMNELRNNPECIGTSIGMLRRAGHLLGYIVQYETCRKPFLKYMNNLINLTISHYMDTRVAIQIASIVHTAQLSNIDAVSGKCLDVPDTPSVEPEILFPNKLPKFPKKDSDYSGEDSSKQQQSTKQECDGEKFSTTTIVPKMNGIKRPFDETTTSIGVPSTSTLEPMELVVENGINGIHQNGNGTSESIKPARLNGIHKQQQQHKESVSPKQDVKAILRNSINHKQQEVSAATTPTASKKAKLEVSNGTPTNGRINGTSPSSTSTAASNGPTTTAATTSNSSSSSMAIVT